MKLPRMIRNCWIYRRVIALAAVLGLALAFIVTNREEVHVAFPFIGTVRSWCGVVMLASALFGAAATWLVLTVRSTLREARERRAHETAATPERATDTHILPSSLSRSEPRVGSAGEQTTLM